MVLNAKNLDNDFIYMPTRIEDLESLNYDYIALGHVHIRQQLGNENIYYSGNPQGFKFKEIALPLFFGRFSYSNNLLFLKQLGASHNKSKSIRL